MILSQKGLVLRFMFIAFYRLKEDLLRDAGDIFLYTYMNSQITELYYVSRRRRIFFHADRRRFGRFFLI